MEPQNGKSAKRYDAYAKLVPWSRQLALSLQRSMLATGSCITATLKKQIDTDQMELHRMEAKLRLFKNAMDTAEVFYWAHHA
jgi:hypothetical protein